MGILRLVSLKVEVGFQMISDGLHSIRSNTAWILGEFSGAETA